MFYPSVLAYGDAITPESLVMKDSTGDNEGEGKHLCDQVMIRLQMQCTSSQVAGCLDGFSVGTNVVLASPLPFVLQ